MSFQLEFSDGWQQVDENLWVGVPTEEPEPYQEGATIPEGYVQMGFIEPDLGVQIRRRCTCVHSPLTHADDGCIVCDCLVSRSEAAGGP